MTLLINLLKSESADCRVEICYAQQYVGPREIVEGLDAARGVSVTNGYHESNDIAAVIASPGKVFEPIASTWSIVPITPVWPRKNDPSILAAEFVLPKANGDRTVIR